MIDRRVFLRRLTLGVLAAPFAAFAQQPPAARRVGILSTVAPRSVPWFVAYE